MGGGLMKRGMEKKYWGWWVEDFQMGREEMTWSEEFGRVGREETDEKELEPAGANNAWGDGVEV
jgi:hypothetical protein